MKYKIDRQAIPQGIGLEEFMTAIKRHLPTDAAIIDIGAHTGSATQLFLDTFPNGRVLAIEPSPLAYQQLTTRFQNFENVKAINCAVGERVGEATLQLNAFDETNSLLASNVNLESIQSLMMTIGEAKVPITTLERLVSERAIETIDILKIDAQGYTYQILEGAIPLLRKSRIRHIYAEVEFKDLYKGEKLFEDITELLARVGYNFRQFYNINLIEGEMAWADAYFTPND